MKTETIRQGETFEVTFTDSDSSAQEVIMTISNDNGIVAQKSSSYSLVDNVPTATITLNDPALVVGDYKYMYTINYSDGFVDKIPDPIDCDDEDCSLPDFIVCEANDVED